MESLKELRGKVYAVLKQNGAEAMLDEELYMALLAFCLKKDRAWDIRNMALRLKARFGGFAGLIEATDEDMARVIGMDGETARFLRVVGQLASRGLKQRERSTVISSPEAAGRYASALLGGFDHEVTAALCLNEELRCVRRKILAEGDAVSAGLDVYEVVSEIFSSGAVGVILCHNHPGGPTRPSEEDLRITENIMTALKDLSIVLLDHVIVSGADYTSLAEEGFFNGESEQVRREYCMGKKSDGEARKDG